MFEWASWGQAMECPRCHKIIDQQSSKCNWCGSSVPSGQYLLEQSGLVPAQPQLTVVSPADTLGSEEEDDKRVASLGDRCIAMLLDALVLLAAFAVVDAWALLRWSYLGIGEVKVSAASILVGGMLNIIIACVYFWVLEAAFGATLGKAIVGIGVVNNSERSALAASAIRNAWRVVDGFGFYLLGALVASCSHLRRRIGDICAGTYVVEGNFRFGMKALAVVLWLGVLTGATLSVPAICARTKSSPSTHYLRRTLIGVGRNENFTYISVPRLRIEISYVTGAAANRKLSIGGQGSASAQKIEAPMQSEQ